jgi:hypothetical protein
MGNFIHRRTKKGCSVNGLPYFGTGFLLMKSYKRDQNTQESGPVASDYNCCCLHVQIQKTVTKGSKLSF